MNAASASEVRPWGTSVLIDARGIDRIRLASRSEVLQFLRGLPPQIGMIAHGQPITERFGTPGSRMFGWTGVQLITTSHIALHACEGMGELYLDITTCGPITAQEVADFVRRYWGADEVRVRIQEREASACT